MRNKFLTALCLAVLFSLASSSFALAAAKLDAYRQMMQSRECTIRFESVTPPERLHNKDKKTISYEWDHDAMIAAPQYVNLGYQGVLVLHGADKYEEMNYEDYSKCRLTKGDKEYVFYRRKNKDKVKYSSSDGEGKISARTIDEEARLVYGESFCDGDVTRLFQLLLPADQKPAGAPQYEFVGQGNLPDGQSYEDYRCGDGGTLEAVRFYFADGALSRIASMSYWQQKDGTLKGRKCIVKVETFSSIPDEKLLTLPKDLKDVTKK